MELLNSISKQTILPNKTLIIINNFKENPEQIKIESNNFIKKAPTNIALQIIISKEKGLSKARNIGMDNCKTEYLIYGDDDDLWSEKKIELILSQLKRHKVPTLIRHGFVHLKSNGKEIQKKLPLRVLSETDWQHWIKKGYVVVKNAVSAADCRRLENALWEFDEKDPNDPTTWYAPQRRPHVRAELNNVGMTEIYHHQAMWDNRQAQRVYDAFVDIWDQEEPWVAIDRANINPPKKIKTNPAGFIH